MLHVLIDGYIQSDPYLVGRGTGRYLRELLAGLAATPGVCTSILLPPDSVPPPSGIHQIPIAVPAEDVTLGRSKWERRIGQLGAAVERVECDVFHAPTFDPPLECARPWVQTLHDLISLHRPGALYAWERRYWGIRAERLRHASAIIAVSRTTADEGIRVLGLDANKVHIVHHGVSPVFRGGPRTAEPDRPYFLFVSAFALHKGYREAVEVISNVAAAGLPHTLKIVGEIPDSARWFLDPVLAAAEHPERVELLGHVPDSELAELYRSATALVVTTRVEGFGLPIVEAMACGAPVVAFDNSCIAEVTDGAAVLVPDGDIEQFASELVELASDASSRVQLADLGAARSATFSWERCVREHVEVYESVVR